MINFLIKKIYIPGNNIMPGIEFLNIEASRYTINNNIITFYNIDDLPYKNINIDINDIFFEFINVDNGNNII